MVCDRPERIGIKKPRIILDIIVGRRSFCFCRDKVMLPRVAEIHEALLFFFLILILLIIIILSICIFLIIQIGFSCGFQT
jgi:hypothetical protein